MLPARRESARQRARRGARCASLRAGPHRRRRHARICTSPPSAGCRRWPRSYAPFPEALDERLDAGAGSRAASSSSTRIRPKRSSTRSPAGHVVVITPTASGKTLCYNAPVLQRDSSGSVEPRAVSVSDQGARAGSARRAPGDVRDDRSATGEQIGVFTYDGDTPQDARRTIRVARAPRAQQSGHGALGHPAAPSALGEAVREPALRDHRRAARLSRRLRQPPRATCCGGCGASAGTTDRIRSSSARRRRSPNPRELAERLTEQPFELVDKSGAPRGEKFFVFVNPPVVNQQLGIRRSYLGETRRIASEFLKRNLQLIVFAQSRLSTEILTTYLKDDFEGVPGAPERIRGYRGGYLPNAAPRDREGAARRRRPRGRVDQRARARHRHRRARRLGDGRLSGHDRGDVAARRPRRPPHEPIGRGDGGQQRAARSVRRPQPVVLLRRVARARADRSRQPPHPRRSHQVRGVRAAVRRRRRRSAGTTCRRSSASSPSRGSCIAPEPGGPWTWTNESYPADAVSLRSVSSDNFVVVDTTRRDARHRRDRLHQRPGDAAPEGDLHRRREAVSGGAARLRRAQGVRARDRLRLLHDGDHLHEGDADRYVRRRTGRQRRAFDRTARSTSSRASSASRRSSSTRTRTSARASWICRNSRCTRRRTG